MPSELTGAAAAHPTISVCVPVYRVHAEPNVASLARTLPGALGGRAGELVVALNGVGAHELGLPPATRTADLGVNRGVAPGWNTAARASDGETLVFVNDDVVLGDGSLAMLAGALDEHPDLGVVGPAGSRWELPSGRHLSDVDTGSAAPGEIVECDVVSGFLFATRRATFDALGGFDEFYAPCSFEEVDFSTAARQKLGLRCGVIAGLAVEHTWGVSRPAPPWRRISYDGRSETLRSIHRRNRRHFVAKWAGSQ